MAISLDRTGTEYLYRNNPEINYNNNYTLMFWAQLRNFYAWTGGVCIVQNAGGSNYTQDTIEFSESTGDIPICSSYINGVGSSVASSAISTNTWKHYCMVRESTTALKFYVDGSLIGTVTTNVTGRSSPNILVVNTWWTPDGAVNADSTLDGDFCSLKIWDRALTLNDINQELKYIAPISYDGLNSVYYLDTDYLDKNWMARNLSISGTASTVNNPSTIRNKRLLISQ